MYQFNYQKAGSADEATSAVAAADDGRFLAGGMTLIPTLKQRLAQPSDLVDLADIGDLVGIEDGGDSVTIKAMTRHVDVANSDVVQSKIPALAGLADNIGDPQVRNRGTIGGSVANNDPAADYPAAVLALNATVITNQREIAAESFFDGMFTTVLEEGELITAVRFPVPEKAAYTKFPNPASRYALVGVMVAQTGGETRVAVTGAGQDGVFRASDIESALSGNWSADAAKGVKMSDDGLNTDIHASAEYRAHLISVMASRAVTAAG
ncbi:MAG: xanthine dehydrogenase family protein subunit M [Rhodospirillaceae bacterium]|jgi:carbon-monoxide dehydrogenase medium subunit|nr:xanthine dehydrogenase family protein subunit M [Rhodospirillaceae bacterium]MBT4770837.1 xanthine dehydrogenase family protein subunit M [Rhodospirillaceae bacterium]MBT5359842.1 xanthine dehydrogenase family protein subunit M [Rhodospirillaceae bacterium]MBT5769547.1 xanthine dehydrogenase family protein subunit M [Rhodospirillaceae bacterium]MBT6308498.1 xanthine dehydrogenase family protein subunit M [Rhodospirillaceae bacterium]